MHRSPLSDLPLMLAALPGDVPRALREAGLPVAPLPPVVRSGSAAGRFVLFDSRNPLSRTQAWHARRHRMEAIDLQMLAGDAVQETAVQPELAAQQLRSAFLERLKMELERRGGVWLRIADVPFPFQCALCLAIEYDLQDEDQLQKLHELGSGRATHFVSSRLRPERLASLTARAPVEIGWQVLPADCEQTARSTLSHWRTRISRFHRVGLAPTGLFFTAPELVLPGLRGMLNLGFQFACCREGEISQSSTAAASRRLDGGWFRMALAEIPQSGNVGDWLTSSYQAGRSLFVAAKAGDHASDPLRELALAASRQTLMWQVSPGTFARWWTSRSRLQLQVWRRSRGYEIHSRNKGDWPAAVEIWRGAHRATVPVRSPVMTAADDGLIYLRARVLLQSGADALADARISPPGGFYRTKSACSA